MINIQQNGSKQFLTAPSHTNCAMRAVEDQLVYCEGSFK